MSGNLELDGFVGGRDTAGAVSWCSAVIEYENELGASSPCDKYFRGQAYYARICTGNATSAARRRSSFPTFLIEIQGPYLRWDQGC